MIFFKTNIIILFVIMGCSNATSQGFEQNKSNESIAIENDITVSAENYKVQLKTCSLKIPSRYKLRNFSYYTPSHPYNASPYKKVSFLHKEVSSEDWSTIKNFILEHKIEIANKKFLNMDVFTSKLQFISSKKVSDISVLRYKHKALKNIDKSDKRQLKNEELYKLNNILIVNEIGFSIIVSETDEYIDEIYEMIEGCAKEMNSKQ